MIGQYKTRIIGKIKQKTLDGIPVLGGLDSNITGITGQQRLGRLKAAPVSGLDIFDIYYDDPSVLTQLQSEPGIHIVDIEANARGDFSAEADFVTSVKVAQGLSVAAAKAAAKSEFQSDKPKFENPAVQAGIQGVIDLL